MCIHICQGLVDKVHYLSTVYMYFTKLRICSHLICIIVLCVGCPSLYECKGGSVHCQYIRDDRCVRVLKLQSMAMGGACKYCTN